MGDIFPFLWGLPFAYIACTCLKMVSSPFFSFLTSEVISHKKLPRLRWTMPQGEVLYTACWMFFGWVKRPKKSYNVNDKILIKIAVISMWRDSGWVRISKIRPWMCSNLYFQEIWDKVEYLRLDFPDLLSYIANMRSLRGEKYCHRIFFLKLYHTIFCKDDFLWKLLLKFLLSETHVMFTHKILQTRLLNKVLNVLHHQHENFSYVVSFFILRNFDGKIKPSVLIR